jgi:hypothetical protein
MNNRRKTVLSSALISGLYNTGVTDSGTVLPNGALDSHYVLSSAPPDFSGVSTVVPYPSQWVTPLTGSNWIGPQNHNLNAYTTDPPGDYVYTLTFNLTAGQNPNAASIWGNFSSDNKAVVSLNGHYVATTLLGCGDDDSGYCHLTPFTIPLGSNFKSGSNTLEFLVTNYSGDSGNPSGLFVSGLTGTVVPIPGAAWLLGSGLIALVGLKRKFSK